MPFLTALDHDALHRVDGLTAMQAIDAEGAIYLAGQPADRVFVVATGAVKLTATTAEGNEVLLDVLGAGSFFGTLPVLGAERFGEDARALTPGCLLAFTAARFELLLDEHPSVARDAPAAVGGRLRTAQQRIQRTDSTSTPGRIAGTLRVLAERLGVLEDGRILIDVPLAREDLASLAGCAPETVSRSLAGWRREGIVDTGRRWVANRRPASLAALAGAETSLRTPGGSGGPG